MSLFDGLTHYWTLNEPAGNSRPDAVAAANFIESGGAVASAAGINDDAANGNNDVKYLSISSGIVMAQPSTLAFWVKMNSLPGGTVFFYISGGATDPYIKLDSIGNVIPGNFTNGDLTPSPLGALATWHLVVLRIFGGFWDISVDDGIVSSSSGVDPASSGIDILGASSAFDGMMDDMAIWNRSISNAELTELYNAGAGTFPDFATVILPTALELALAHPTAKIVTLL